ncbi:hypothetical protein HND25_02220 [Rhodococcus erythropolis]|uniref:hypothetical protein n=1 Tax=Rhodococcus erythropolis TaxID=1833 RepID=UPI000766EBF3|nr:hypothetical protein [Rhodococcus erythropolis]MBO8145075.1 hypothetical protein [Rhodococcus erythropolis]MDO1487432.1 hypothetical protein [Rhodococcus erythropolis]GCB58721.1 hypothetical protein rerp_51290 [Rhodococcus erythropolis]
MNELLDEVLTAHGGVEHWQSVLAITARGRLGGLLPQRFPGNKLAKFTVEVEVAEQRTVLQDFPRVGECAVFDKGVVRIGTRDGEELGSRTNPRSAFFGLSGVRRNLHWDALDTAYFAGYAFWNYLTAPLLLARDDITVAEAEPWQESGQQWRRLQATFAPAIDTHCRQQTFYVDNGGLIRRHDFVAEPVGNWAKAALYCDQHREFDGLTFPTRRRVLPRGPGGRVLSRPTLLALDFDDIEIKR